jgi:hypothetical protein
MRSKRRRKVTSNNVDDVHSDDENWSTSDIYDDKQREEMLEADQITKEEASFMEGREMEKLKGMKGSDHKDSTSVELVKEEYKED